MAEKPAKAFGIYGKKGALLPGFDADIVLLDPQKEWEITAESLLYKNKISAFVGKKGTGMPVCTVLRGEVVAEDGRFTGTQGYGELVRPVE